MDQAKTGYATVDAWFREVSYQQTSLVTDVVGWYTLPLTTAGCDYALIQSKARQAATAAGVNLVAVRAPGLRLPVQCQLPVRGDGVGRRHPVECVDQWQYEHGPPRP